MYNFVNKKLSSHHYIQRMRRMQRNNSTFCPHSVFMCFVWIPEPTVIISLYSIDWLVFITETECVYCAVPTGSLYMYVYIHIIRVNQCLFTAHSRVQSQTSPWGICGAKKWHKGGIVPVLQFPPVSIIPLILHARLHLHVVLTGRTNGMGTFRNWGALDSKVLELSQQRINIAVRFVSFQALHLSTYNLCHCTGC